MVMSMINLNTYPITGGLEVAATFSQSRLHPHAKRPVVSLVQTGGG